MAACAPGSELEKATPAASWGPQALSLRPFVQVILVMQVVTLVLRAAIKGEVHARHFRFNSLFVLGVPGGPVPFRILSADSSSELRAQGQQEHQRRRPFLGAFSPLSCLFESFLDSPPFLGLSSFLGLSLDPFGFSFFSSLVLATFA